MRRVLLLTRDGREACALQEILDDADVVHTGDLSEMKFHLEKCNWDVLFFTRSFHDAFWTEALQEVRKLYPHLAVVGLYCTGGGLDEEVARVAA